MKIAHLSDLHICQKSRPKNLERTRLLIDYALQQGTDHFVFTGDIVHLGEAQDFIAFRNLLDEYDLLDSAKVTMVIGNHDVFGGVYLAEDILSFPQKCEAIDYRKKFIEFKNYFFETFENTYFTSSHDVYPFAKIVDDVVFIGMNSTMPYSRLKNLFASKGKVGKRQLNNLRQILLRSEFKHKIKICLIHHHFERINNSNLLFSNSFLRNLESLGGKLRKKSRLIKLLQKHKIDLILHGHEHESVEYWIKNLKIMNAGGCIDKNKTGELKINFIEIKNHQLRTEVQTVLEHGILGLERFSVGKLALAS